MAFHCLGRQTTVRGSDDPEQKVQNTDWRVKFQPVWYMAEVTNSVRFLSGTFLLILQFWAFQHQWNVNLPKSLVVCWFPTIGRSMLHWKLNEGSLAAGFLPMLCNVLLEWGPGWDVQYFPKVSDSIMWQLEVKVQYNNLLHWFTDWNYLKEQTKF